MFERLKRLYENGRLDIAGLINAKKKGLIDENQFFYICGMFYDEATGNKAGEGEKAPKKEVIENG